MYVANAVMRFFFLDQECYRSVIPTANPDNTTYQLRISFVETTSRTTNSSTPHDKPEYLVQNQVLDDKKKYVLPWNRPYSSGPILLDC